jgi:hypothetical protein
MMICNEQDRSVFIQRINQVELKGRSFVAEFKMFRKPRTLKQNNLFHMLLTCITKESEVGRQYTVEELKEYFLGQYAPWYVKEMFGKEKIFYKRSHNLNTKEMTVVIDGVYKEAVVNFDVYLPMPNEPKFDDFYAHYGLK